MSCTRDCLSGAWHRQARKLVSLLAATAMMVPVAGAWAQAPAYPAKTVRIVPYGPGGSPIDVLARIYGEQLRRLWGQAVVVDPKPGASGILAADAVAKAAPDGYTILITLQTTHINNAILHSKLPYDPIKDFQPLSQLATGSGPVLLASVSAPYSNIAELIAYAKKKPALTYGTWGVASSAHLFGELLRRETLPGLIHVPYKTESTAHQDLDAGRLDLAWANPGTARTLLQGGRVKILAAPGARRTQILPEAKTFAEQGLKGFELDFWIGAYAPAGISPAIRDKLVADLKTATQTPEVRTRIVDMGFRPLANTPQEFETNYAADYQSIKQLITAAGITPTD